MTELVERLGALVTEVAEIEIAPRFLHLMPGDIVGKPSAADPDDLVTAADRAAEAALSRQLLLLVPGSCVVGEESTSANPEEIHRLGGDGHVWVVDPLDGTKNFASGKGPFGSMVALIRRGKILLSAIYLILEKELYLAELGAGAYRNGDPLQPAPPLADPIRGTLYTKFTNPKLLESVNLTPERCQLFPPPMCAAFEYARLARTDSDFALFRRLHPWDHAPGALLLREMGGVCRYLDGNEYSPLDSDAFLLAAASESRWHASQERLMR